MNLKVSKQEILKLKQKEDKIKTKKTSKNHGTISKGVLYI